MQHLCLRRTHHMALTTGLSNVWSPPASFLSRSPHSLPDHWILRWTLFSAQQFSFIHILVSSLLSSTTSRQNGCQRQGYFSGGDWDWLRLVRVRDQRCWCYWGYQENLACVDVGERLYLLGGGCVEIQGLVSSVRSEETLQQILLLHCCWCCFVYAHEGTKWCTVPKPAVLCLWCNFSKSPHFAFQLDFLWMSQSGMVQLIIELILCHLKVLALLTIWFSSPQCPIRCGTLESPNCRFIW
jgi:hypothetical protein